MTTNISKLRGMRFPDEYVVRMFFKEGLANRPGRVLELGCGSANNLMLFASHGWQATGVDYDAACLRDGMHNLQISGLSGNLQAHDLNAGLPPLEGLFDVILAPSSLYYITRESAWHCMRQSEKMLVPGGLLYLRMRLPDDHRVGRGAPAGEMAWHLDCGYTGELGALNVFWHERELVEMFEQTIGITPSNMNIMRVAYENIQGGRLLRNSDIVLWGRKP